METSVLGIINETRCFEWKIPEFFSQKKTFFSPSFSSFDCRWRLELKRSGDHDSDDDEDGETDEDDEEEVTLKLSVTDFGLLENKAVVYTLGLKQNDGKFKEEDPKFQNFTKDRRHGAIELWELKDLKECKSDLEMNSAMTFTCRIENSTDGETAPRLLRLVELEALSSDFKDLLTAKNKCDVTIKVKDKEFQAHRAVLAARCSVFEAMFKHGMTEEETGVVTVSDCDPDSFGVFLLYLYSGKVEDVCFRNQYYLYVTADKYDVQVLKSFSRSYMMQNLAVENVCDVVTLAERFNDAELMSAAQRFFNHNVVEIISKSEWETLMKNSYRLANRLLKEMTSKVAIIC